MQTSIDPKRKVHKKEQKKNDGGELGKNEEKVNPISLTLYRFHQFLRVLAHTHPKIRAQNKRIHAII